MNSIKKILFFLLLLIPFVASSQIKREMRMVWLTTNYGLDWPKTRATSETSRLKQQQELRTILDKLQSIHINTVMLQVRLRGDVLYPSVIEPWCSYLSGRNGVSPGYDPLAFAIEECHKRGMECHAWMVAIPVGTSSHVKQMGKRSIAGKRPDMVLTHNGEVYLNPGHPETAPYILSLVKEVVNNYDIDGIHLDYIRYPENSKTFPDQQTYKKAKTSISLNQWRCNNISRIVFSIHDWVKATKPWVKISSAPLGRYTSLRRIPTPGWTSLETVHQDVKEWFAQGKHDFIVPMMYARNKYYYPYVYNWMEVTGGKPFAPGLGVYQIEEQDWSPEDIKEQLLYSRHAKAQGQGFYRVENLMNKKTGIWDFVRNEFYTSPAILPQMNPQDTTAPLPPLNASLFEEHERVWLQWQNNSEEQKPGGVTYNVYGFKEYPHSLENAEALIATQVHAYELPLSRMKLESGIKYLAITATDRWYNESKPLIISFRNVQDREQNDTRLEPVDIENSIYRLVSSKHYSLLRIQNVIKQKLFESRIDKTIQLGTLPAGSYQVIVSNDDGEVEQFQWIKNI